MLEKSYAKPLVKWLLFYNSEARALGLEWTSIKDLHDSVGGRWNLYRITWSRLDEDTKYHCGHTHRQSTNLLQLHKN